MANEIDSIEGEVWKPVLGWEGLYEVSSHGRVKRLPSLVRTRGRSSKDYMRRLSGGILRTSKSCEFGYRSVMLCNGKVQKTMLVHIIVCEAFHGPKPTPKHEVAHWDGVPDNNRSNNLRWATRKENGEDKVRHGRSRKGMENHNAVLTESDILEIRSRKVKGVSSRGLAKEYGVSQVTIDNIVSRRTWKHL